MPINRRAWLKQSTLLSAGLLSARQSAGWSALEADTSERIKLSGNENPYGPFPSALKAMKQKLSAGNRYAMNQADEFKSELAAAHGLHRDNILLGAGSSQLLHLIGNWVVHTNRDLIFSSPTFEILPDYVTRLDGSAIKIPVTAGFTQDLKAIRNAIAGDRSVVYLVNPNNPTGVAIDKQALQSFCQEISKKNTIILDEAYIEYLGESESLISWVVDNPNILVLRTFSKVYGLAGMRIGYLAGHADVIDRLKKYQIWRSDSLTITGIVAAHASMEDTSSITNTLALNDETRGFTVSTLKELNIACCPSSTNFIFFPIPGDIDLRGALLKSNILIGQLSYNKRRYARVTIGKMWEMQRFLEESKTILN